MNEWRNKAACKGAPVDIFFANRGHNKVKWVYQAADRFCESCTVKADCLEWILEVESSPEVGRHGYYAGMSPDRRAELHRKRQQGRVA